MPGVETPVLLKTNKQTKNLGSSENTLAFFSWKPYE
jgi:hypothetical protein